MVEKDMDVINRVNKAQRQEEEQKALEPLKISWTTRYYPRNIDGN